MDDAGSGRSLAAEEEGVECGLILPPALFVVPSPRMACSSRMALSNRDSLACSSSYYELASCEAVHVHVRTVDPGLVLVESTAWAIRAQCAVLVTTVLFMLQRLCGV